MAYTNGSAAVSPHYTTELTSWAVSVLGARLRAPGSEWADFKCRAHSDKSASASINLQNGWIQCQADGCGASCWADQYAERYGVPAPPKKTTTKPKTSSKTTRTEYVYEDAQGNPYMKTLKKSKPDGSKDFRQARFEGGKWIWSLGGIDAILFRLPQLLASKGPVIITEGEKDVHAAERLGFTATTTPMGAGKAHKVKDWSALAGRDVILLPDNDDPGRRHMAQVAELLEGVAASVRTLELPELPEKGDLSDWVALGGTREKLLALIDQMDQEPEWEPLLPLEVHQTPVCPLDCLPLEIEAFCRELSTETQTPPDLAAMASLAQLAICLQGRFAVNPLPSWRNEALCLMVCPAAKSGERKSAVLEAFRAPFDKFEREARDRWHEASRESRTDRDILEQQEAHLLKRVSKATPGDLKNDPKILREELIECRRLLGELGDSYPRRLLVDDSTPEALAMVMDQQGGPIGLFEAEGGMFRSAAGGYSSRAHLHPIYLKPYARESLVVDRVNRESNVIEKPALSCCIMTQVTHLVEVLAEKVFQGRGFNERILFGVPESRVGSREVLPSPMKGATRDRYYRLIESLLPPKSPSDGTPLEVTTLEFSDEARRELVELMKWLEKELGDGGKFPAIVGWANRLPGFIVRIATNWSLAEDVNRLVVPADVVRRAIRFGRDYLLPMAMKAFGLVGLDPRVETAKALLRTIQGKGWTEFTKSDLLRAKRWPAEKQDAGLELLCECGYLRAEQVDTGGKKPTTTYHVNPAIFNSDPLGTLGTLGISSDSGPDLRTNSLNSLNSRTPETEKSVHQPDPVEDEYDLSAEIGTLL